MPCKPVKRHRRRLALIILLSFLNHFCVAIEREKNKISLSIAGDIGGIEENTTIDPGCSGPTGYGGLRLPGESRSYSESYDQMGGQIAVRFEHRQGFLAQLAVGRVVGRLKSTSGFTTDQDGYELTMLGMGVGFDARYIGADLGVFTNVSGEKTGAFPRANLRLGQLEYLWFEIGTDPMGGRTVGLGLNIGMGFITRYLDGHLGYNPTGNLQPLVTMVPGREGSVEFGGPPGGIGFFYGSLGVRITDSFGLHLGGTAGNTNSLHLGFSLFL